MLEKRLDNIEAEIKSIGLIKAELDEVSGRFQAIIEQMEKHLDNLEKKIDLAEVKKVENNNGELLSTYGILKRTQNQEEYSDKLSGRLEV
ncbi:Uncharacterised protein [Legionella wadsworthii]|uniref:Coiled-coil protein n=1 Tax=Legionella wadsworthii TaxID=28088 RepID=A0A378LUW9_9GAMM|nr:hypothetical protein [Legionella wadsworthii]STY30273.1 Uncharacterised protein [Legionella wadsworthii]